MDRSGETASQSEKYQLEHGDSDIRQLEHVLVADRDKDEALHLVGLERAKTYSEEEYRKLRRKLVPYRCLLSGTSLTRFHASGLHHCASVHGSIRVAIFVSSPIVSE